MIARHGAPGDRGEDWIEHAGRRRRPPPAPRVRRRGGMWPAWRRPACRWWLSAPVRSRWGWARSAARRARAAVTELQAASAVGQARARSGLAARARPPRACAAPGAADGGRRARPRTTYLNARARCETLLALGRGAGRQRERLDRHRRDHVRRQRRAGRPGGGAAAGPAAGAADRHGRALRPRPGPSRERELIERGRRPPPAGRAGGRRAAAAPGARAGCAPRCVAAEMASAGGVESVIASGAAAGALRCGRRRRAGRHPLPADPSPLPAYKLWLRYGKPVAGTGVVDTGARQALERRGASLLPVGVTVCEGASRRATPSSWRTRGTVFAIGVADQPAAEMRRASGRRAAQAAGRGRAPRQPGGAVTVTASDEPARARPRRRPACWRGLDRGAKDAALRRSPAPSSGRRRDPARPTPPTSRTPAAAGASDAPARPADARPRPASRPWPTRCARSPRCPTRSARSSTAGGSPTASTCTKRARAAGRVLVVYEARPNVTVDAAALCLKSGNAAILRGSRLRDAPTRRCSRWCARALARGRAAAPTRCRRWSTPTASSWPRSSPTPDAADVVIPRGGEELKDFLLEHAAHPGAGRGRRQLPRLRRRRRPTPTMALRSPSTPRCSAPASATRPRRCSCTRDGRVLPRCSPTRAARRRAARRRAARRCRRRRRRRRRGRLGDRVPRPGLAVRRSTRWTRRSTTSPATAPATPRRS